MCIASRQREIQIVRKVSLHFLLCLCIILHDGGTVVACCRQDAETCKREYRGKAEQRKINRKRAVTHEGNDTVSQRRKSKQCDRHSGPAVAAVRTLKVPAAFCGCAQSFGQLRTALQIVDCVIECLHGFLRLCAHRRTIALLFLPAGLLLGNAPLGRRADTRNRRVLSSDNAQEIIDLLLVLEIAHLLSAVELHDQIGQRGENALAGKAALAHRNALVHTRYHGKRNIIPPVNKKAVQIEGMLADAARTDFPTGFFILGKRRVINAPRAERIRFQHFPSPRNYRYGWPQPTAQRNGRLQQCYYIQADFFAPRFLVARMNSASSSAANTMPIGYATAVL